MMMFIFDGAVDAAVLLPLPYLCTGTVESAPFKLTAEFVELMGGPSSECFKGFREVSRR